VVLERMGSALAIPPPHASVRQDSLNKQPLGVGVYQSMRKSRIRCDDGFRSVRIYQRVTGRVRGALGGIVMANPEKLHADT